MAIYTGIADANGDFSVPFSSTYTGGQKITVTAEKDNATKSIEIFAPSDPIATGAFIEFSGTAVNFPMNIGDVTLSGMPATIASYAFSGTVFNSTTYTMWARATGLTIPEGVVTISEGSFYYWIAMTELNLPQSLKSIGASAFDASRKLVNIVIPDSVISIGVDSFNAQTSDTSTKNITIGSSVTSIGARAFNARTGLVDVVLKPTTPPTLSNSNAFPAGTYQIKVPAASLAAYQTAPNWSVHASKMVGY